MFTSIAITEAACRQDHLSYQKQCSTAHRVDYDEGVALLTRIKKMEELKKAAVIKRNKARQMAEYYSEQIRKLQNDFDKMRF